MCRYALRDNQWDRIKDILPGREWFVGVTAKDNRLFIEAVLYRYRAGIPWRDLLALTGIFSIKAIKAVAVERTLLLSSGMLWVNMVLRSLRTSICWEFLRKLIRSPSQWLKIFFYSISLGRSWIEIRLGIRITPVPLLLRRPRLALCLGSIFQSFSFCWGRL